MGLYGGNFSATLIKQVFTLCYVYFNLFLKPRLHSEVSYYMTMLLSYY